MSKMICLMGESGSGKTTAMRTLDPSSTYYIDCDRKGLPWRGWREQYNAERKNFFQTRDLGQIGGVLMGISEKRADIKTIVIDTLNTAMVDQEVKQMAARTDIPSGLTSRRMCGTSAKLPPRFGRI